MNRDKRKALEAAGWVFGNSEDFLELSDEERGLVELHSAVSDAVHARRLHRGLTQSDVAKRLGTSQPRVAKIEAGASEVSLDLMFRSLFALGGTMEDVRSVMRKPTGSQKVKPPARASVKPSKPAKRKKPAASW